MTNAASTRPAVLDPSRFDGVVDGQSTALYTLRNANGMVACISSCGAKIMQLLVPGRHGDLADVVLGYDSLDALVGGAPSMGAFIGRYAGRLENAAFTLDGQRFPLGANNGPHCLHGGHKGSRFRVFDATQLSDDAVEMRLVFADGEEGFPGTLALRLTYRLTDANELVVDYEAQALDRATVANFTTHAFFNLEGTPGEGSILGHEVQIAAEHYFGMSADLVATGEVLPVDGTAYDFRQPVLLDARVRGLTGSSDKLDGYDSCYLIKRSDAGGAVPADGVYPLALGARVRSPRSGRVMAVWSTEPTLQFFTGLQPQEALAGGPGKLGRQYMQQQGLCVEPQGYPNAPNRPGFPSAVCRPGQVRRGTTLYRFSMED